MTLTHFVHAAAGDTTWEGYGTLTGAANFNPRIHGGCDGDRDCDCSGLTISNPRIREGCDSSLGSDLGRESDFNPRIREGCDSDFETYKRRNHPFCTQNTQKYNLIQA